MFFCFTRPRYQVSVYRTIGPLVFISFRPRYQVSVYRTIGPLVFISFRYDLYVNAESMTVKSNETRERATTGHDSIKF